MSERGTEGKKPGAKEKRTPPLDERTLRESKEFTIVFEDGKGFKCKLDQIDNYNLVVISEGRRLLIPKHSIRYVVL